MESTGNVNKMYPANHKTVFVLDHTPYFGISSESPIEFEFLKSRTPGYIPMNPISKSLWTCSVESAAEYCRIVWDLFPQGKMVRFIASDNVAHILNGWNPSQQNLTHVMNGMALIGVPPLPSPLRPQTLDYSVLHGLRAAVEVLSEMTDNQMEKHKSFDGGGSKKLINRCRVICITSARDNKSMNRLEEIFHNVLQTQNKLAIGTLIPIDYCHLVIINTFPVNVEPQVGNHTAKSFSPLLTTEVHSIKSTLISNKLSTLILEHYDLASTTVTGIPMKEEQNASSSANYDVEIYHASAAHSSILKGNHDSSAVKTVKDGLEYETVTLKWCTPRGCSASELQNCTSMHRITPVDVNSRPSLCLINFLLNGRSVMLEMIRKSGGKITSHLLASHGGEIFIHTLNTARSILEDPPSISEGCGGRITDYRIPDFGLLIQQNKLLPVKSTYNGEDASTKMKTKLNRHTKYWPMTISSTLIFNLKNYIDPLPDFIIKEKITDEEVMQCNKVIFNIITLETKHESLHLPNTGQRTKGGQKKEEQYKIIWNELETLIKSNLHTDNHRSVYNCLMECHKFNTDDDKLNEKVELDQALRELDQMSEPDCQRATVIRATTDSPMSPPPLTSIAPSSLLRSTTNRSTTVGIYTTSTRSLYDILSQEKPKTRPEFSGRNNDHTVTKLYQNLVIETDRCGARGESIDVE